MFWGARMNPIFTFLFSVSTTLLLLSATAMAERRGGSQPQYFSAVPNHVLPVSASGRPLAPRYEADPPNRRGVEFNYRYALENPSEDHVMIKLNITDPNVLAKKEKLFARVRYFDLSDDSASKETVVSIRFEEGQKAFIDVKDLKAESVYRMDVDLFTPTPEGPLASKLVSNAGAYWGVTSGKTEVAKARHKVTTTMLLENEDWQLGRRGHGNAPYLNMAGGWCGEFPHWCSKPYLKVFDEEPSDSYAGAGSFFGGFQTPVKGEAVHGNYGLIGAHKFTVLGYSPKSGRVYTIEGNFNNSVGMNIRSTGEFSGYGKISDAILWKDSKPSTP